MATATESLELGAVQAFFADDGLIARLTVGIGHDGYRRMLAEAEFIVRLHTFLADGR